MVYYEMTRRLEHDQKNPQRPRQRLDQTLEVGRWHVPGGVYRQRQRTSNSTPAWWSGDEDASQTFLHAMGVVM